MVWVGPGGRMSWWMSKKTKNRIGSSTPDLLLYTMTIPKKMV